MISFFKKPIGIVFIVLAIGGIIAVFVFSTKTPQPTYDFVIAEKRTIIQEVSISGNIQPAESAHLSFEKTGTVFLLPVKVGQIVKSGQLLAQLNTQDAQKEVRNAEVALESATLALEKIIQDQAQLLRGDVVNKNYEDGLARLGNLYNEFDSILQNVDDIYLGSELSSGGETNIQYYANSINDSLLASRIEKLLNKTKLLHTQSLAVYLKAERGTGESRLQAIQSGYDLTLQAAETIKIGRDAVRYFQDTILSNNTIHNKQTIIDAHAADLTTYATSMDTYLKDLLAILNTINTQVDSINNYPLTIRSQEITITQREHDLKDAKDNLKKYSITSPLAGVITKTDLTIGEIVAANSPVITLISEADFEIETYIPEADITKVHTGNTAAATLDAYGPDSLFEAVVTEIEPAETIIEGVTTYRTVLQFTQEDNRVKPGMTADITIFTAQKEHVIAVPQRAIIRQSGNKFLRIVRNGIVEQIQVQTGLQGSDGTIEITSGINEGEQVITFFPE